MEALLVAGSDVDHADADGWTPLRSAAWAGHVEVVDVLLAKGAQVCLEQKLKNMCRMYVQWWD